ncbi:MAG: exodeoxyribonuclease V subunit beta [Gammaproteobacteria bacterium]|nr:exodeoxyribonuclease V subunit beta [Gammaproteobacteria bacterium]
MNILQTENFPLESQQLIEASAGTGKTYTITNLYLRLLLGHSTAMKRPLAVNEILVLTFTIAATEELRHRIRERILAAKMAFHCGHSDENFMQYLINASDDNHRDTRLLAAAIQLMDEAAIFTIHGFCARVLHQQSFETGILFDQDLDGDRDQLLQMAAEDCFRQEILTLPVFERNIALRLWPNPNMLIAGIKGFLFRHKLIMLPAATDTKLQQETLSANILEAKRLWLKDDLPAIIKSAGFNAKSKCLSNLEDMSAYCLDLNARDPENPLWENWSADYLDSVIRQGNSVPDHRCLKLIDEIWQSSEVTEAVKSNLWRQVTGKVIENLNRYKTDSNQFTLDDLLTQLHQAVTTNHEFAMELANIYPCAMVDEFQDTDDIQYGIFKAIYSKREAEGSKREAEGSQCDPQSLILIGDPKQAVYQFRGADVFTYINARRSTGDHVHRLDTNWRSSEPLVSAVNFLFNKQEIFDNDTDIPFTAVKASEKSASMSFTVDGAQQKPFSLFLATGEKKELRKDDARHLVAQHAAERVSKLLSLAAKNAALIDGEAIDAGQIAFLVRDKNDARAARDALSERGIRSVYVTLESVFLQDTADDLKLILQAVLEPTNNRAIKAALATPLMQSSISEIDALNHDVILQQRVTQEFLDYHQLWATRDIAPMIESLIVERKIAEKWLGQPDGERQITNLRHLSELLQQRSAIAPGMHRLLKWFNREKIAADTVAGEERQLRLESDENLVKIVTMHAAKGLEYDIVYIPFGGFWRGIPSKEPALFHRETKDGFETCLEFGASKSHRSQAQRESVAEDMRLLYVAITRARHHCCLGIPNNSQLSRSALARLLNIVDAKNDSAAILKSLDDYPLELFEIDSVVESKTTRVVDSASTISLVPPPDLPSIDDHWRLHSYTGVTRLIKTRQDTIAPVTVTGFGDDDDETDTTERREQFNRFTFPRGPRVGVALHSLLENLDFSATEESKRDHCERCLNRIGITSNQDKWRQVLLDWLEDILRTPITEDESLRLADISYRDRLNELEFHFPLDADVSFLSQLQKEGYMQSARHLSIPKLQGMMTGIIDLIVRHQDRYYLIDYKSNHLGDRAEHYSKERLDQAVAHHQYDLQYLIYCVALNRFLTSRLPDYEYNSHFGGVQYLFLRGMNGETQAGVFFDKPDGQLLQQFDNALGAKT